MVSALASLPAHPGLPGCLAGPWLPGQPWPLVARQSQARANHPVNRGHGPRGVHQQQRTPAPGLKRRPPLLQRNPSARVFPPPPLHPCHRGRMPAQVPALLRSGPADQNRTAQMVRMAGTQSKLSLTIRFVVAVRLWPAYPHLVGPASLQVILCGHAPTAPSPLRTGELPRPRQEHRPGAPRAFPRPKNWFVNGLLRVAARHWE